MALKQDSRTMDVAPSNGEVAARQTSSRKDLLKKHKAYFKKDTSTNGSGGQAIKQPVLKRAYHACCESIRDLEIVRQPSKDGDRRPFREHQADIRTDTAE